MRLATRAVVTMIVSAFALVSAWADGPAVTDAVAARQYPWNGMVDITCKVSGIESADKELQFAVAAVMPDSGEMREVSQFWVVKDGTNSTDRIVHANGDYQIVWDARADLGAGSYSNIAVRVTLADAQTDARDKVQLWEGGPYWATENIGSENPWDYGYYFWWGDTVGYRHKSNAWLASDGSPSNFSFSVTNTPTYGKDIAALQDDGWITSDAVLSPEHDAAQVHWGGSWRMPTDLELIGLTNNCDWTWERLNGFSGYVVSGRGDYASASIFLPVSGYGEEAALNNAGSYGCYWSSDPDLDGDNSRSLYFRNGGYDINSRNRSYGQAVRPVQGFISSVDSAPFLLDLGPEDPVMTPESGTVFEGSLTVSISCPTEGVAIYYTTDGSEPTKDSTAYSRFKINGKTTVKAVAYDAANDLYSRVTTAEYALGTCANPVIAPDGGSAVETEGGYEFYNDGQTVAIAQGGDEGTLRYTLDGTDPTAESEAYSGAIEIDGTTTVKAKVFSDIYFDSEVVAVVFTRELEHVATPEIAAEATFTGSREKCEISCATEGAAIYYTLDGNDPTSQSTLYAGAFYITESCTLKAFASLSGYYDSEVAEMTITKEWAIGDTMGAPDHAFTTSGDNGKGFYRVEDASAPNGEAMHSGDIGNSSGSGSFARTVLSTTVAGPGTVSFSWKSSCEDDAPAYEWDHGEFAVDGVVEAYVSGETGWTNVSVAVAGDGTHTLTWTYLKDDAESSGEDCIWVAGYGWESEEAYTHTTEVPVPYEWLRSHDPAIADEYDAYEDAAKATAANGRKVWECFAMGFDPSDPLDDFRITAFWMDGYMPMFEFSHTEDGAGNSFLHLIKPLGKAKLEDPWQHVPEGGDPEFRFFSAEVLLPGSESVVGARAKVQLWEDGPYWSTTNIGAEKPWDSGYYFWWGDTVGYKLENDTWVASDGSSSGFSFDESSVPTHNKSDATLLSEGWITSDNVLAPECDAAQVQWGGNWRMPTDKELRDLYTYCDWTWTTTNGVSGYVVSGRGDYASASIFLPAPGYGSATSLSDADSLGRYWSSVPSSGNYYSWYLTFNMNGHSMSGFCRYLGQVIRPVQGSAK